MTTPPAPEDGDGLARDLTLDACAISLVLSSVILYAAWNFGYDLGIRGVAVFIATFLAGFIFSFARLRRRA